MMYKLSIITINRNNAEGLRKTMESVFAQTYRDFEYIVVDGASTDESVDVIKEIAARPITHNLSPITFTWLSEPDTGIYNAMNKGIEIAKGVRVVDALNRSMLRGDKNKGNNEDGYVLMLNSGDFLVDEYVIEKNIPELDGTDIIQGNEIVSTNNGKTRCLGYAKSDLDLFDVLKGKFLHQASFCRRDLFERYGYFDESYKIAADTKFFMLCLGRYDASYKYVNIDVADYDMSGISSSTSEKWVLRRYEEYRRVILEVFSKRIYSFMLENDKKVRLYNDLHAHKWIWYLTMAVAHINNWIYKRNAK